jgi:phosphatidate cytidylyltransferase
MKKLFQRLLVFFIGVPLLVALVLVSPHYRYLPLNLCVIIFTVLGAVEFRNILAQKNLGISLPETIIFGAISPVAWTLVFSFGVTRDIISDAFILGASWLLVSRIFTSSEKLDSYIGRIAAGLLIMIYPGLFMAWIIRMALFRETSMVILVFLFVVLLNDAIAWVVGMLFGKNSRGLIPASPSKSIVGFIGGLAASVLMGIAAPVLIPSAFTSPVMPSVLAGAILGLGAGTAATLGDLSESAIKRSAGVKDSGSLILGRGGALDSIDSLALAAPVFYILYRVLFWA